MGRAGRVQGVRLRRVWRTPETTRLTIFGRFCDCWRPPGFFMEKIRMSRADAAETLLICNGCTLTVDRVARGLVCRFRFMRT
jgi:hypothetical protein